MKKKSRSPNKPSEVSGPKVAMSYRLSPAKIARAQRVLGTTTATATIEEALDMVVFRQELMGGIDAAFGIEIAQVFPDARPSARKRRG